jgi:UDP-N-acetylmuramate: L-alanyl-gamma-D-glutamyl-meso-diaminopimelate ligase
MNAANLGWDAAEAPSPLGEKASVSADIDVLGGRVAREARSGDHVLVMSNGGFGGIHGKLPAALRGSGDHA